MLGGLEGGDPGVVEGTQVGGDSTTVLPRRTRATFEDEHGRGLQIVGAVASDWGTRPTRGGKPVWCTLALRRPPATHSGVTTS